MPELKLSLLDLLLLPVALPLRAAALGLGETYWMAYRELYDPATLRKKLVELQMSYELGEVDEEYYRAAWAGLTERLRQSLDEQAGEE